LRTRNGISQSMLACISNLQASNLKFQIQIRINIRRVPDEMNTLQQVADLLKKDRQINHVYDVIIYTPIDMINHPLIEILLKTNRINTVSMYTDYRMFEIPNSTIVEALANVPNTFIYMFSFIGTIPERLIPVITNLTWLYPLVNDQQNETLMRQFLQHARRLKCISFNDCIDSNAISKAFNNFRELRQPCENITFSLECKSSCPPTQILAARQLAALNNTCVSTLRIHVEDTPLSLAKGRVCAHHALLAIERLKKTQNNANVSVSVPTIELKTNLKSPKSVSTQLTCAELQSADEEINDDAWAPFL
jgi:hypothetical protein